jgi:hypothetical protein
MDSTKNGNLFDRGVRNNTNLQEIAGMFKIVRWPTKLQPFFAPLQGQFLWDHFQYFRLFVLLIAFAWGRRTVTSLYRYLDEKEQPHRSRFNNFLNLTRWQPPVVLALKASELLAPLSPKSGETVELILDDSKKRKRGKALQAVSWMKDPITVGRSKCFSRTANNSWGWAITRTSPMRPQLTTCTWCFWRTPS